MCRVNFKIFFGCVLRVVLSTGLTDSVTLCLWTEFFEELLSLVYSLTSRQISARMWQILPHLYRLFFDDNVDLFVGE